MKVKSIKQLVSIALSSNAHVEIVIGKLPIKQARIIEKIIGENLVGCERLINTSAIKHTLNAHGSPEREEKRGQIAVTIDDFQKIPLILKEPDSIKYAGKNKRSQDVFLFTKKIGFTYIVAECVRNANKKKLDFGTMYKRK